jgi:two-component system chemotaxis response regulator CheB
VLLLLHGRHIPAQPQILAPLLQRATTLPVRTASAGMSLADLGVTVLPYGSTATLDRNLQLQPVPASRTGGGDALLAAAAGARGAAVIGVILTGLLRDGAHGVRAVKRGGGRVLAEDPRTARAASMPAAAIASGCVDFVLPVHRIATALVALAMAPGGADLFAVPTPAWASR